METWAAVEALIRICAADAESTARRRGREPRAGALARPRRRRVRRRLRPPAAKLSRSSTAGYWPHSAMTSVVHTRGVGATPASSIWPWV